MASFSNITGWLFDLDNTLYSPYSNLFPQIHERMQLYIMEFFGRSAGEADTLRYDYFKKYGTTMRGLMEEHKTDPQHFMDYVHDVDLAEIRHNAALAVAIQTLPGKKIIFTNADQKHANRILRHLGMETLFDTVFDIADGDFICKPDAAPYEMLLKKNGLQAAACCMFDDMEANLKPAAEMGMTTVWHRHSAPWLRIKPDMDLPRPHCHYIADDLSDFLHTLIKESKWPSLSPPTNCETPSNAPGKNARP
jgi:putative hydrolase of the HAD superfamily